MWQAKKFQELQILIIQLKQMHRLVQMIYTSDVSGITNVYVRETDTSGNLTDRPITNSLSPVDQISVSKDGKKMLFVSQNKGAYDIFSMDNPFDRKLDITEIPPTEFVQERNSSNRICSGKICNGRIVW